MSSIPLPALDVKTPQQQDLTGQFSRLEQLRALQQQQQIQASEAPLRQQALQQQVQSGQLSVEQQQREQASQQAIMDAYSKSDGNLSQAYDVAAKSGKALPGDLIKLRQAQLTTQSNALDLLNKQGAKAVQDADLYAGATDAVNKAPEASKASVYQQQLANLQQAGVDISKIPPQYPGDQQFAQIHLGVQSHKAALDQAAKVAQTDASKSTTAKNQAETDFYAQNGGAPGVSAEIQQQTAWLKDHPGKDAADYKLWTLRNSPTAMVMGNQFTPQATALAAQNLLQTGQGPQGMYRSPGTISSVYNAAAALNAGQGGAGIAANKATFQANEKSLASLQKNYDQVQAFEQTASKNFDLLQQTASKIPDLGTRFANVPVRMLNSKMLGTEQMAAFNAALNTAQTEAAKVLNSSNASGVLSDSARHELQQIIDPNTPYKSIVASLNTLKQDMANRTQAYQQQISGIQDRIKGSGSSQQQPAAAGGALKITRDAQGRIIGVE